MPPGFGWSEGIAVVGLVLLLVPWAVVGFLWRKFATVEDRETLHKRIDKAAVEHDREMEQIQRTIASELASLRAAIDRSQDKGEARYATVSQLNGATDRLGAAITNNGRRIDEMNERLAEVTTEARSAFNLSQATQGSVAHLAQRLEDVITRGLDRLDKQVDEITKALREGNGNR